MKKPKCTVDIYKIKSKRTVDVLTNVLDMLYNGLTPICICEYFILYAHPPTH